MPLYLGDEMKNFMADSTHGKIDFYKFVPETAWAVLFSHPQDFTPVCTTELAEVLRLKPEFEKRHVKVICLSCDPLNQHELWAKDIIHFAGMKGDRLPYPIIADPEGRLAREMGILDEDEMNSEGSLLPCRAVIVIGPGRIVKLLQLYPVTTGRNFKEIIRVLDSLQLAEHKLVVTPANWKVGDKCIVNHKWSLDKAREKFPTLQVRNLPSEKEGCTPYLKYIDYETCATASANNCSNHNGNSGNNDSETSKKTVQQKPYRTRNAY